MDLGIIAISSESSSSSEAIRLMVVSIHGKTTVVIASPQDILGELLGRFVGVEPSLHAVYQGQDLPLQATIGELGLKRDAMLHLTRHPHSWSLSSQMIAVTTTNTAISAETREFFKSFIQDGQFLLLPLARYLGLSNWPMSLAFDNVTAMLYSWDTFLLVMRFLAGANALADDGRSDMAVEYLAVLLHCGVAGHLVNLYVSTSVPHRCRGKSAITCLVYPEITITPSPQLDACLLPLCLEFCRMIPSASGKGRRDPLYEKCRNRLAAMLSLYERVPTLIHQEMIKRLIPIAIAATDEVIGYLDQGSVIPANKRFEFSVFFKFMCEFRRLEIRGQAQRADSVPDGPVGVAFSETAMSLLSSVYWFMERSGEQKKLGLAVTNEQIQQEMTIHWAPLQEQVLVTKERHQRDMVDSMWVVLGQLDLWSETHDYFAVAVQTLCKVHAAYLSALVLGTGVDRSRCLDIGRVVTKHKDLLGFEARRHFATAMLPEMDELMLMSLEMFDGDGPDIVIDRSRLLEDSFRHISEAPSNVLHALISVEFLHEEAIGEGVMREWLTLVFQELFDPELGLFLPCPRDRRRFFLNPASGADPRNLKYYNFAGRMIGLALTYNVQVGVRFHRTLFFQLVGRAVTLDDIGDADPCTHASYKKILEMDPDLFDAKDGLSLTFARAVEVSGSWEDIELLRGGRDIAVDSKNRGQYIDLLIQNRFITSTKDQLTHFANGFCFMLAKPDLHNLFFESLHLEDLDNMLGGRVSIDMQEWKEHTRYDGGYTEQDDQINWFWKAVASMTTEEQRRLLFFWTSVEYLPFDGFRGLLDDLGYTPVIYKTSSKTSDHLPSSSTCMCQLNLPFYTSFAMTLSRLQKITQEHVSISFGVM